MIKLAFDPAKQRCDLALAASGSLATDDGLETAVVVSLFTDARARVDDEGYAAAADPRGWWGESFLAAGYALGSRLWQLRALPPARVVKLAPAYAEEALAWLVADGVASRVAASAALLPGRRDVYVLTVDIYRPQRATARWRGAWEVQLAA